MKLLGVMTASVMTLAAGSWMVMLPAAALSICAQACAWDNFRQLRRDIGSLWVFYLITIAIHSVSGEGERLIRLSSSFAVTGDGLARGVFFAAKIVILAAVFTPLLRTTHPSVWGRILNIPNTSRSSGMVALWNRFALTLGLAVGFLPMLLTEAERTHQAQACRGAFQGGWLTRMKDTAALVVPLMASSLRRVDLITDALRARGFQPDAPRSVYRLNRFGKGDALALVVMALSMAAYGVL